MTKHVAAAPCKASDKRSGANPSLPGARFHCPWVTNAARCWHVPLGQTATGVTAASRSVNVALTHAVHATGATWCWYASVPVVLLLLPSDITQVYETHPLPLLTLTRLHTTIAHKGNKPFFCQTLTIR
jgi:hypothetical protein